MLFSVELASAAIVALYLVARFRAVRAEERPALARRLLAVAAFAWLGEDSMIRAYHFYSYAPGWHLFVDEVPLAIALIWPLVIDSAQALAARLVPRAPSEDGRARALRVARTALVAGLVVLVDASLVEPIAVAAGLWRWSAPGFFAVPPVGVLGWAIFTALVALVVEARLPLPLLGGAVLGTHVGLVLAWWGALRWVSQPLDGEHVAACAWLLFAPLALVVWRSGLRRRVPLGTMLIRVPPALLFLVLLLVGSGGGALWLYAAAFVAPYCALVGGPARSPV